MEAIVEFVNGNEPATQFQAVAVVVSWAAVTVFNMWFLLRKKPRNGKAA